MDRPGQEFKEEVSLYVSGDARGGAGSGMVRAAHPASNSQQWCAVEIFSQLVTLAQLNVTIQWIPDPDGSPVAGVPGGLLKVTPTSAIDLKRPEKIIRDLSTYVDYTAAYVALMCFGLYLLGGFAFYQVRVL